MKTFISLKVLLLPLSHCEIFRVYLAFVLTMKCSEYGNALEVSLLAKSLFLL